MNVYFTCTCSLVQQSDKGAGHLAAVAKMSKLLDERILAANPLKD